MWPKALLLLALVPTFVHSLAPTDEIQDADPAQSGYMNNHNMHPSTVGSAIFGQLWKKNFGNNKEKWYAKPLVYTPPGQSQLVFLASSMNIIRTVDAVNGTLLNQRTVQPPFLQSDIGCTDIPDYIGIIGTPIIDPNTNTVFFFSKGYKNGASNGGVANGIYQFYAVDILTLQDKPGFPILVDGRPADNDNARYFIGGTVLQRPSLTMINGYVIGAFGGHCDLFNYTGMLVSISTQPWVGVASIFAMESSPGAPPVQSDIMVQKGGKAGIWSGGMGIATDNGRIYVVTGNGIGHANGDVAASGRTPMSTLDEVVANFAVSSNGKITLTDYFEPYEYISMDAGDRDLGSSGVTLLDPATFYGTGISRMAVTIGKNGKAYVLDANNLGGFKQGSGGTDNIIQTITGGGAVFGGAGSYPLEGGYIYFTPVGYPTVCYKMGLDSAGKPIFTQVGATASNSAGRVGIGIPTITTYKGQPGTGILWISDPSAGLQAFNAVPVNGVLTQIPIPATGGLNKFQRPAFGDARLYTSDTNGNVICLGSPVALPLNCSTPVDFGDVSIGSTATRIVDCTALIAISSINGCTTGNKAFQCNNATLPKGALAQGATFSFPVTWNLTQAAINDAQNASFGTVLPGVAGTNLNIYTTNVPVKYSNDVPIALQGNTVSQDPFLTINPPEVDFGGIVVGSQGAQSGLDAAVIISNVGAQTLTFLGSAWTGSIMPGDGPIVWTNITNGYLGSGFSSISLPQVGDTLSPGASISVPLNFLTSQTGAYTTFVEFWTTGGNKNVLLTGSASTAPIANISVSTIEGGWDNSQPVVMDFGNVMAGNTTSRYIRICNSGGSSLTITKSKPPIQQELLAPNANTDLHEGQVIPVNTCATGQVSIIAAPLGVNRPDHSVSDVWILNTDDVTFGVHDVVVQANIVTRQLGPLLANGSSEYMYLGCYYDGGGRQMQKQYNFADNENGKCLSNCFNLGYMFAGTEYHTECWCGNKPPAAAKYTAEYLKKCAYSCPGDVSQACGGDGTFLSLYYDRTRYTPGTDSIPAVVSSSSVAPSSSSTSVSSASTVSSSTVSTSSSSSVSSVSLVSSVSSVSSSSTSLSSSTDSISTTSTSSLILGTTSSSTSTAAATTTPVKPTGPTDLATIGAYSYVGCYTEATTGRALSLKSYYNDSMTVEMCYTQCQGFAWFGVEYRRECYCGNNPAAGSVISTTGNKCDLTCLGDPSELCGGRSRLSMYNNLTPAAVSGSSSSALSSTSSTSSSSSASVPSSSSTSDISSSTSSDTSSSASSTPTDVSASSSSSGSSSASSTDTSSSVTSSTSSAPSSSSTSSTSDSTSSTSSTSSAVSSTSDSTSSTSSTVSSTSSSSSSTLSTPSSTSSSPSSTPPPTTSSSTTSLLTTTKTTSSVLNIRGFTPLGCFADPATGPFQGHNMPKFFSNDSMTPDLCISSALARLSAKPATTFAYVGLEYGRECYAATVAPTPQPTSLTGAKACTMTCKGDGKLGCGGPKQYNLWAATTATITGTGTTVWNSAPAVNTVG